MPELDIFPSPTTHRGLYDSVEGVVTAFEDRHTRTSAQGVIYAWYFSSFSEEQLDWLNGVNDRSLGASLAETTQIVRDGIVDNPRAVSPFARFPQAQSAGIDDANAYFIGWMSSLRWIAQHPVGRDAIAHTDPTQFPDYIPAVRPPDTRSGATLEQKIGAIRYNALSLPSHVTADIRRPRLEAVQVGMSAGLLAVEHAARE